MPQLPSQHFPCCLLGVRSRYANLALKISLCSTPSSGDMSGELSQEPAHCKNPILICGQGDRMCGPQYFDKGHSCRQSLPRGECKKQYGVHDRWWYWIWQWSSHWRIPDSSVVAMVFYHQHPHWRCGFSHRALSSTTCTTWASGNHTERRIF